jgi:DNA-binding LytR/AlgR family response regulator
MKVLIIEDEPQAAQRLEKLVQSIEPGVEVVDRIDSVKHSVEWLSANKHPDLIFMDIHLADGISFSIFEQCEVKVPVIFTTAYDAYALKAFKVNSVDYILKPVDKDELEAALKKFKDKKTDVSPHALLESISQAMSVLTKKFKTRFVIKVGEHLKTVEVDQVLYFYSQEKTTFCHVGEGRNLILDYTLEQLEEMVDPGLFFRINRKYLIASRSIVDIISHTNSRLKLLLKNCNDNDIIVARERVQQFKEWLDR